MKIKSKKRKEKEMKGEVLSFPFVYFRNRDFSKITGDSNKKNLSALMALADPPTRHLPEIDDPPAHDPMNRRDRPALDERRERRAMRLIEPPLPPRRLALDQAVRPCALNLTTQSRTT
jgi:hypothetical protein